MNFTDNSPRWSSAGSGLFGDETISDSGKGIFSVVTETQSLIPKPPFALDTIIASAIGEFRFQPHERM